MADRRTCYADELAGYHLGMEVGFTFVSVLGNKARFECILLGVWHSTGVPFPVTLTLGNRGELTGHFEIAIAADTVVDVAPAS